MNNPQETNAGNHSGSRMSLADYAKAAAGLVVIGYFLDINITASRVAEDFLHWGLLFVGMFWVFSARAWNKNERSPKAYVEIAGGCFCLLLVFAFLTEGYGCAIKTSDLSDCRPAGPAIYNGC